MSEIEKSKLTELAERINKHHRQVETAVGRALDHARLAGKFLVEAKEKVRHGEWLPWLETNFEGSERVAQMYMRVHGRWAEIEANTKSVSDLTLSGALKSIAASPAEITRERVEGPLVRAGSDDRAELRRAFEVKLKEAGVKPGFAKPLAKYVVQGLAASASGDGSTPDLHERHGGVHDLLVNPSPYKDTAEQGLEDTVADAPSTRGNGVLEMYVEAAKREERRKEAKAAERGVGVKDVWRIVRAGRMEYVVEFGDGERGTVGRGALLGTRFKKCDCCSGYGVVEK